VYEPDKPSMMEVTDPNRDLLSCMRGEHGVGWYVLARSPRCDRAYRVIANPG
jgi:hypothetical protein